MAPTENPYQPPTTEVPFSTSKDAEPNALASRGERLGAQMLDGLIVLAVMVPLQWFSGMFSSYAVYMAYSKDYLSQALWGAAGLCFMLAINGYFLARRAQSIGKMAVGTKIVTLDGVNAPLAVIVLRRMLPMTVLHLIPFVGGVFALADALVIFREDRRCLHDHIAGTRVVRA
jgi:uncharacterized RDD family membrane protein YckC